LVTPTNIKFSFKSISLFLTTILRLLAKLDFLISINPWLNISLISLEKIIITLSVASGNIYFWSIVSKDAEGNTSESGVYQFKILE
jgi:hypothetical protein